MESSAQFRVAKHVQDLVGYMMPTGVSDQHVQRYTQYCMRILSSRIQPLSSSSGASGAQQDLNNPADADHIKTQIMRKLAQKKTPAQPASAGNKKARAHNPQSTSTQDQLKFEEAYARFTRSKSLSKHHSLLHLLSQLSNQNGNIDSNQSDAAAAMVQGSVLESVFSTKLHNQTSYQQPTPSQMDAVMSQNPQPNDKQKARQLQINYLKKMRYQCVPGAQPLDEDSIVRQLIFVFQDIDGTDIKYSIVDDAYILSPQVIVSPSVHKLIQELCELGWLYRKVNDWLKRTSHSQQSQGVVNQVTQSLAFSIQGQLTEYYRLMAVLQSQHQNFQASDPSNYLNLRKLYLWVQEPLERMKWLAVICDTVRSLKGGAICSAIHTFVLNGNPATKQFVERVLREVSAPILGMVKQWMLEGEITDPYNEFFIEVDVLVPDERLWTDKYKLNHIMIPTFMSNALANKILATGKAVNFIRKCCDEQEWVPDQQLQIQPDFNSLDSTPLEQWVDACYSQTNAQLKQILFQKYQLEQHCQHIRKYLLMGQGDLMEYLMDLMAEELQLPASKIYKHNLRALLDTAIRSSNAQYHPQSFISRLDVKLWDAQQGDRGWEIFFLDYKVDDLTPLQTVFTKDVMKNYEKIFAFLWKLKRIQHWLSLSWGQNMAYQTQFRKIQGPLQGHFHRFNLAHHEMQHFVSNFHNYILVEVLESSWHVFLKDLHAAKDLDEIISLQRKFVSDILDKALLSEAQRDLYKLVQRLLNDVYMFSHYKEKYFYKSALQECERQERVAQCEQMGQEVPEEDRTCQVQLFCIDQINQEHMKFYTQLENFRKHLEEQNQTNLKYLLCRMDYNYFYDQQEQNNEEGSDEPGDDDDGDDADFQMQYGQDLQ